LGRLADKLPQYGKEHPTPMNKISHEVMEVVKSLSEDVSVKSKVQVDSMFEVNHMLSIQGKRIVLEFDEPFHFLHDSTFKAAFALNERRRNP